MSVLIITIIVGVVLLLVGIGIGIYNVLENGHGWAFFSCLASLLSLLILLFGTFCKVPANSVGIIYDDRKGILEETKQEGFQTKSIFEHITTISTANRSANLTTTGQTNDGQYATFQISLIYKINKEDAGRFYKQTNNTDLPEEALNTIVKSSLQTSTIDYNIFEVLSNGLDEAKASFTQSLKTALYDTYYVTLIETSFDDIDAGDNVEAILQQKAEAEQKIEIAKKDAESNLIAAENEVKIAEQKALVEKTLAEAQAYAIKVEGQANAETATAYITKINEMIDTIQNSNSLTYEQAADIVLSIVFYDTWDGKLPEVLTSDSLSGMIGGLLTRSETE